MVGRTATCVVDSAYGFVRFKKGWQRKGRDREGDNSSDKCKREITENMLSGMTSVTGR